MAYAHGNLIRIALLLLMQQFQLICDERFTIAVRVRGPQKKITGQ